MDFGGAIEALRSGEKVARKSWEDKEQFIYLVRWRNVDKECLRNEAYTNLKDCAGDMTGAFNINSHIDMHSTGGSVEVGWAPSQSDMLAEDWMIV